MTKTKLLEENLLLRERVIYLEAVCTNYSERLRHLATQMDNRLMTGEKLKEMLRG